MQRPRVCRQVHSVRKSGGSERHPREPRNLQHLCIAKRVVYRETQRNSSQYLSAPEAGSRHPKKETCRPRPAGEGGE